MLPSGPRYMSMTVGDLVGMGKDGADVFPKRSCQGIDLPGIGRVSHRHRHGVSSEFTLWLPPAARCHGQLLETICRDATWSG